VNKNELKVSYEALPEKWKLFGGKGLIAKIMNSEVFPDVALLGERSKLIIAGGPLAGTLAPMYGRISIGGDNMCD
jgi:aldehyde:ferredoxin oxidoreductase